MLLCEVVLKKYYISSKLHQPVYLSQLYPFLNEEKNNSTYVKARNYHENLLVPICQRVVSIVCFKDVLFPKQISMQKANI